MGITDSFIGFTRKIGLNNKDSVDQRLKKQTLVMVSVLICIAGLIWGTMFLALSYPLSSVFPYAYSLVVGLALIVFHFKKNFSHLLIAQLVMVWLMPSLLQISLGGIYQSGAMMIWSFLAPMGSLMFQGIRKSVGWFLLFIVSVCILIYFDNQISELGPEVSPTNSLVFFTMNFVVVGAITFSTILYFVSEQIRDKARNMELLEITRKNKEEIENQHKMLVEQAAALQEEKSKTQNLLQKVETLLGQHVSDEVAKELVSVDGEFDSKLCQASIMFLDIRDFTSYAESRLPKEVASFQNIVFGELINTIRANKGIINQILGDGLMATFGAPVTTDSHSADAVDAGYAIIGRIAQLIEEQEIPPIKVGIGIHSGKVLAGNIGNQYRKQYSLTGKTVIIAARIEQLNKEYKSQFLISEAVYHQIKNNGYPVENIGKVDLKGLADPVEIYKLV